jgi:hypothetical protein
MTSTENRTGMTTDGCRKPYVNPIGFDVNEPEFEYHGESAHPAAVWMQCMCGHPDYIMCEIEREATLS